MKTEGGSGCQTAGCSREGEKSHVTILNLPVPASARSRKRKRPLKVGLRKASSEGRSRGPASAMGRQAALRHTDR